MNPNQDTNRRNIPYPHFSHNYSQPSQNMSTMNHQSTTFGRQVPYEQQYPTLAIYTTPPHHHLQPFQNRQPPSYLEPQVMMNESAFHPANAFDQNNLPHPRNGQSYHQFDHINHFQVPDPFSRIGQVSHAMNQTLYTPMNENRTNPIQMNYGHSSMNQSNHLNNSRYPSPALQANITSPYQYSATFYEPENGSHSFITDTDTPFGDSLNSNSTITHQTPGRHQDRIPRSFTPDPQTPERLSPNGDTSGLSMLSTVTTPSSIAANNDNESPPPALQMPLAIISRPQHRPKNPDSHLQKKLAEIEGPVGDNRQAMGEFRPRNADFGMYRERNSKKSWRKCLRSLRCFCCTDTLLGRAVYHSDVRTELIALDAAQHPPYSKISPLLQSRWRLIGSASPLHPPLQPVLSLLKNLDSPLLPPLLPPLSISLAPPLRSTRLLRLSWAS